jgi:hypothetical protein
MDVRFILGKAIIMTHNTSVTVSIPDRLYRRLESIARATHREVADVLIASVEATLPINSADADLPAEVADELAAMRLFSDEALWVATKPTLSASQQAQLNKLTEAQGTRDLTASEQDELEKLLAEYDRSILRRAQALALLSLRGHDLPDLNDPTPLP